MKTIDTPMPVVPNFEPSAEDQVALPKGMEDATDLQKAVFLKVMQMEVSELLQYVLGWELRYYELDASLSEKTEILNEMGFGGA